MFFAHAFDDPVTVHSTLALATELKKNNVSAELHVYATGGHGYGMRPTDEPVTRWPIPATEWMKKSGFLIPSTAK
jgi:dipeptidyl aminopeptidase/acylaminoacyl peptidase